MTSAMSPRPAAPFWNGWKASLFRACRFSDAAEQIALSVSPWGYREEAQRLPRVMAQSALWCLDAHQHGVRRWPATFSQGWSMERPRYMRAHQRARYDGELFASPPDCQLTVNKLPHLRGLKISARNNHLLCRRLGGHLPAKRQRRKVDEEVSGRCGSRNLVDQCSGDGATRSSSESEPEQLCGPCHAVTVRSADGFRYGLWHRSECGSA